MSSNKTILRLIDLVFILLFGFVAISQQGKAKAIEAPSSIEAGNYEQSDSLKVIIVGVLPDGSYPIDDGSVVQPDSVELARFLQQEASAAARENRRLGVRIRARWDSPLEYSMFVARACRKMGISKGLDVMMVRKDG